MSYTVKAYSKKSEGNKKVSTNFKVKEFACKDGSDIVLISCELVKLLQSVRTHFGKAVTITSGYRTVNYNSKVSGSSEDSKHCYGLAADIKVKGVSPKTVASYIETLIPNSGGIGIYSTFVHVDARSDKSRWNG